MTVQELIDALSKAHDRNALVDIIDTNGDPIAAPDEFVTVDEDGEAGGEGRMVHIVIGNVTL